MTAGLKRYYGQNHIHFITFSRYQRLPLLSSAASKDVFVEILGDVREKYGFALIGYVVMPEHIHLLIGEPSIGTPSTVLQVLKRRLSVRMRDHSSPRLWQSRFYDFNVWSRKKRAEKLLYMHLNPVKRGLVAHPADWRWSSFGFYQDGSTGSNPHRSRVIDRPKQPTFKQRRWGTRKVF
jgi:putative transposase